MQSLPKFPHNHKDFSTALHKNVNQYFKDKNTSKYANGAMIFKSIFHLSCWIGSYFLIILGGFDAATTYVLWAILGFFIAMVSVNIGHDAIHGAYSKNKTVNQLLSHTFNINGASAYMWKKMHNVAHHTYTNVDGLDEDIESGQIVRLAPKTPVRSMHKFQHIYAFLLYGLATFSWVYVKDYKKFFTNEVGNYTGKDHPKEEYFYLFFYKFINLVLFVIIPFTVIDLPWQDILLGYLLMHYVAGTTLAMIFMLAHVIEEVHFLDPDEAGNMPNSRDVHQLYTTADFSNQSRLASFLTGGLNMQVEHHLFPHICSIHYRDIAKIVRKTASEYDIPYYESSFLHAVGSHYRYLKKMGKRA